MKTYHERTQDILERIEKYRRRKRRRIYALIPLAACLLVLIIGSVAVLPSLLQPTALPPAPGPGEILSSAVSSSPAVPSSSASSTGPTSPSADPETPPGAFIARETVSFEQAKQALGWELIPCEDEDFAAYVLLTLGGSGEPIGLCYEFRSGTVQIRSDALGEPNFKDYQPFSYQGEEFLVSAGGTVAYREGTLTYTADFAELPTEQACEKIWSLRSA